MKEVFKKMSSETIELTDGYVLIPDPFNGIILQRETEKTRTKKDKTEEKYTHIETIYQPTISKTLTRYLQLSTSETKSIEELKAVVLRVENKINQIKESW